MFELPEDIVQSQLKLIVIVASVGLLMVDVEPGYTFEGF